MKKLILTIILVFGLVSAANALTEFEKEMILYKQAMEEYSAKLKKRGTNLEEYFKSLMYLDEKIADLEKNGPKDMFSGEDDGKNKMFVSEIWKMKDDQTLYIFLWIKDKIILDALPQYKDGVQTRLMGIEGEAIKDKSKKWYGSKFNTMLHNLLLADWKVYTVYSEYGTKSNDSENFFFVNLYDLGDVYKEGWF